MALEPHRQLGPSIPPGLDAAVPPPARAHPRTTGSGRGAHAMRRDPPGPQAHQLAGGGRWLREHAVNLICEG
eukprot:1849115-Alexandrium_andersonii.AAC.1